MKVSVQIGVSEDCKKHHFNLEKHATVGDLKRLISTAENSDPFQVTIIIKGRRLKHDEELLSALLLDNPQVIAVIGKKKSENVVSETKTDPYNVTFPRKPFGIIIRSNNMLRDAYISDYENDYGRSFGVQLGSKITHINGVEVDGWKTVEIEEQICKAKEPVGLTLLPREALAQSEQNEVLESSDARLTKSTSSELSRHLIHPLDYVVQVDRKEMGLTIFSGPGLRGAYIVAFTSPYGPRIGIKAGSMFVAINGVNCEDWLCSNIQKHLNDEKLPISVTLRAPDGLTSRQYPVLFPCEDEVPISNELTDGALSQIQIEEKTDNSKSLPKSNSNADGEMYTVVFLQRPLGFGIMSPLGTGVMVSSVQDKELIKKGLVPGTPIIAVGGINVQHSSLAVVARLMSRAKFPVAIDFSKEMYFKPGDKVLVQFKDEWYRTTIKKFNPRAKRVSVSYDDKPFRFKNHEHIQDFSRIRKQVDLKDRDLSGIFSIHA